MNHSEYTLYASFRTFKREKKKVQVANDAPFWFPLAGFVDDAEERTSRRFRGRLSRSDITTSALRREGAAASHEGLSQMIVNYTLFSLYSLQYVAAVGSAFSCSLYKMTRASKCNA